MKSYTVTGIHCGNCVAKINAALAKLGAYKLVETTTTTPETRNPDTPTSLYPLYLIATFIAVGALAGAHTWQTWATNFMAGFFLVFSFFKLLNLKGFADAYATYDLLAAKSRTYALAYPFIELALGLAFTFRLFPTIANVLTLALMLFGSLGVARALLQKRRIQCACLGTVLNLPMTHITLAEDLLMATMAALMLAFPHI